VKFTEPPKSDAATAERSSDSIERTFAELRRVPPWMRGADARPTVDAARLA
jgi:hypothetical protein